MERPTDHAAAVALRQRIDRLSVRTRGPGLVDVTAELAERVARHRIHDGLLTVLIQHTSASLLIQENADPDVQRDLEAFLLRLVPEDPRLYRHVTEGPDDMPAHVRSALTQTHLAIPIAAGRLALGTWQGVYVFEHRHQGSTRHLALHLLGTP
jgi:secondary thiamine-phosphate synthase enzyme